MGRVGRFGPKVWSIVFGIYPSWAKHTVHTGVKIAINLTNQRAKRLSIPVIASTIVCMQLQQSDNHNRLFMVVVAVYRKRHQLSNMDIVT